MWAASANSGHEHADKLVDNDMNNPQRNPVNRALLPAFGAPVSARRRAA
jgi:hypothetical protein